MPVGRWYNGLKGLKTSKGRKIPENITMKKIVFSLSVLALGVLLVAAYRPFSVKADHGGEGKNKGTAVGSGEVSAIGSGGEDENENGNGDNNSAKRENENENNDSAFDGAFTLKGIAAVSNPTTSPAPANATSSTPTGATNVLLTVNGLAISTQNANVDGVVNSSAGIVSGDRVNIRGHAVNGVLQAEKIEVLQAPAVSNLNQADIQSIQAQIQAILEKINELQRKLGISQ